MNEAQNRENKGVIGAIIILALALAGLMIWNQYQHDRLDLSQTEVQAEVSYQGVDGQTALALLRENHEVTTKNYTGVGEFVTAINGIEAGSAYFWAFYVNGQMAQVGADQYTTAATETITWRLEPIN